MQLNQAYFSLHLRVLSPGAGVEFLESLFMEDLKVSLNVFKISWFLTVLYK